MMSKALSFVPHNRPTLGIEEIKAANAVITSGNLSQGKQVEEFENEICQYLGYENGHAVAVSSGSAALYFAIRALGDKNKKIERISIPAYSCAALRNAVTLAKKQPVYLDVSINSPNIDLNDARSSVSDLIIACHMFGIPMKMKGEMIIEDCAQSFGATINGKKIGTQTDIAVFSFYATKPITSGGEGGMVVSKDESIIEYLKDLRDFDMKNDAVERFNFQMTDLQAAIGRIQLSKLEGFIEKRRYLAERYISHGIQLWNTEEGNTYYRGLVKTKKPEQMIKHLKSEGIISIIPIEKKELLCSEESVPRSYNLTQTLVSIPLYPSLTNDEQDRVIKALKGFMEVED